MSLRWVVLLQLPLTWALTACGDSDDARSSTTSSGGNAGSIGGSEAGATAGSGGGAGAASGGTTADAASDATVSDATTSDASSSDAAVNDAPASDALSPGNHEPDKVQCGDSVCEVDAAICCLSAGGGHCTTFCDQGANASCDGPEDCPGQHCCGTPYGPDGSIYSVVACQDACNASTEVTICGDGSTPCPDVTQHCASAAPRPFNECQ